MSMVEVPHDMSIEEIEIHMQSLYNEMDEAEYCMSMMKKELLMQQNIIAYNEKLINDKLEILEKLANKMRALGMHDPILAPTNQHSITVVEESCISGGN